MDREDIKKCYWLSRKVFCEACPKKIECDKEHYDAIENTRYPVSCEWLDRFDATLAQKLHYNDNQQ